ncbi:ABC-type transport auxiliary lipoprotein family protein, partial [Acinetobacter baumannii]
VAAAAVPEYLDRAEIVSRTRTNEILLSPDSRWAEGLSVNAQRVVTENLSRLLASDRVVMLPTRTGARVEIEVFVELMACEIDAEGRA